MTPLIVSAGIVFDALPIYASAGLLSAFVWWALR